MNTINPKILKENKLIIEGYKAKERQRTWRFNLHGC